MKANKKIVLCAINNFPGAFQYCSLELRNDREVVISTVRKDGL